MKPIDNTAPIARALPHEDGRRQLRDLAGAAGDVEQSLLRTFVE